jgi:hypothetical protein
LREIHARSKCPFRTKSASAITSDYLGLPWITLDFPPHNALSGFSFLPQAPSCNHLQPSATIRNYPQPSATICNLLSAFRSQVSRFLLPLGGLSFCVILQPIIFIFLALLGVIRR